MIGWSGGGGWLEDLRQRSSEPSCWPALPCSRRFRCRNGESLDGRCNLYGTWSKRYSCGTWTVAPAGWPGWRRGVCTCACTNGFETVAPRRTTCRLRNRRFEWGIPAACKTTFIWFFLSLSLSLSIFFFFVINFSFDISNNVLPSVEIEI